MIPYGRQSIDDDDCRAVADVLRSEWLTAGPKVKEFEEAFARYSGSRYAVAVSSGTAALHLACLAAGLEKGDELITTSMSFCASANCALYCGAKPVFADIDAETGLIDPGDIAKKVTPRTKVILPVHYAGQSCDLAAIAEIANAKGVLIIEDACHALGATYKESKVGDCKYSSMCVFSFHPVKHITTGEGGMITTNSSRLYENLLMLRSHGITRDPKKYVNRSDGAWYYEMQHLGFNYRMTDFQCALGANQLRRAECFLKKRRDIASKYDVAFKDCCPVVPLKQEGYGKNAYHLYAVKAANPVVRRRLFDYLRGRGIFCQVHYIPIYLHPYYAGLGYEKGLCPQAEEFYGSVMALPIFPDLTGEEQEKIIVAIKDFFKN